MTDQTPGNRRWPFLRSLQGYSAAFLSADLIAGLTLAAIAIPEQMATSRLGGFTPEIGFYAFIAGSLGFALVGANRFLSCGADSTITPIFAGGLALLATAGSADYQAQAAALALLVGILLMGSGVFRLGGIANLLSLPVTVGFLAGISVHIIVSQLPGVLGLPTPGGPTLQRIATLAGELAQANIYTVVIGLGVLAIVTLSERISARIPGALIGLVGATLLVVAAGLEHKGVGVVGTLKDSAHSFVPSLPIIAPEQWAKLIPLSLPDCDRGDGADRGHHALVPVGSGQARRRRSRLSRRRCRQPARRPVRCLPGQCQPAPHRHRRRDRRTVAGREPDRGGDRAGAARLRRGLARTCAGCSARRRAAVRGAAHHPGRADRADLSAVTRRVRARRGDRGRHRGAADRAGRCARHRPVAAARHLEHDAGAPHPVRARAGYHDLVAGARHGADAAVSDVAVVGFQAPLSFLNAATFSADMRTILQNRTPRLLVLEAGAIPEIDFTAAQALGELIKLCRDLHVAFAVARLESVRAQAAFERFGLYEMLPRDHVFHSVDQAVCTLGPKAGSVEAGR